MDPLVDRSHIPAVLFTRPRRVRSGSLGCGIWFLRLFILPHTVVGFGFLAVILLGPIWVLCGTDHPARVIDASEHHGSKSTSYNVTVDYDFNGESRRESGSVSSGEFHRLGGGQASGVERPRYAPARVRTIGERPPLFFARILDADESPWWAYLPILGFGLFWNSILSVFLYIAWIQPMLVRRLYRVGAPKPGLVTNKRTQRVKNGTNHLVDYQFKLDDGELRTTHMVVPKAQWETCTIGQRVTVLHFTGRRWPSVIYEFGGRTCW